MIKSKEVMSLKCLKNEEKDYFKFRNSVESDIFGVILEGKRDWHTLCIQATWGYAAEASGKTVFFEKV